jgi:hypothetical protein
VAYRIECSALQTVTRLALATFTLCTAIAFAQSEPAPSRLSPIHLEATVTNVETLTASATGANSQPTTRTSPRHAKAKQAQPAAAVLKLEMKQAARQVVLSDQANRQRLIGFGAGNALAPNVLQNLRESATPPVVTVGDRPARSMGLCGDGKVWRFAELDGKTVAGLLPEFNALRPRTVCAKRGVVIADYAFK